MIKAIILTIYLFSLASYANTSLEGFKSSKEALGDAISSLNGNGEYFKDKIKEYGSIKKYELINEETKLGGKMKKSQYSVQYANGSVEIINVEMIQPNLDGGFHITNIIGE